MGAKYVLILMGLLISLNIYPDAGEYMDRVVDETGRVSGFKSIVGFINPDKDFISFSAWHIFDKSDGANEIKFYETSDLKGAPKMVLNSKGLFVGEDKICYCGQVEINHRREVRKVTSSSDTCSKGYSSEDYIYCPNKFPFFYGHNGYFGQYILQYDEKVSDKIVRVEYDGKSYFADLSAFKKVRFESSKSIWLEKQREEVAEILNYKDFGEYLKKFSECLTGSSKECVKEYIGPTEFTDEAFIERFQASCLTNYKYPLIEKKEENVIWIYSSSATVCVFSYVDGKWRYTTEETLGC